MGDFVEADAIAGAITSADIVILAIPFGAIGPFISDYAEELKGKIIVDPSNPIAPDANGGFTKVIGETESAGEIIAQAAPEGARLVKAFGTLGAATLTNSAFQTPERAVLFFAGDDRSTDEAITQLIAANGFDAVRIGGIDQSGRIEVFGDLHEFGALGKTVTLTEAQTRL